MQNRTLKTVVMIVVGLVVANQLGFREDILEAAGDLVQILRSVMLIGSD